MLCGRPIAVNDTKVACQQCMNCRINKKRMWTGRIMLEAQYSKVSSTFLTMTYDDLHLPENKSVSRRDLNIYINRLRDESGLGHFRYFAVGEYGDQTGRPHYHMAIFGNPPETWEKRFQDAWHDDDGRPLGFTKAGEITPQSASYIAGYCTKKMTSEDDERLDGRNPEFSAMSRRPPLGAAGMLHIKYLLMSRTGAAGLASQGDVPTQFRMLNKGWPIGKYWRNWLRLQLNITKPRPCEPWEMDVQALMQELHDEQKASKTADKLFRESKKSSRTL